MLPVLKESSKGGKKKQYQLPEEDKYKEISQMLGESKIKKKKMLELGRLGLGGGQKRQKISICLLGSQRVRSLCYKIASLPRPCPADWQRTIFPLTFSSVALPLLPGRWSGNSAEFPTLRKASSTLAGDHLAGLRLRNCGSSEPSQPFQLMTDHTAAAEAAGAAESLANHRSSPNENTLSAPCLPLPRLPTPL